MTEGEFQAILKKTHQTHLAGAWRAWFEAKYGPIEQEDTSMSAEIDQQIDAARERLLALARQPFSFGSAKQAARDFQRLALDLINILDQVNGQVDKVSQAQIDSLKAAATALAPEDEAGKGTQ